jgi:hypothetical protein
VDTVELSCAFGPTRPNQKPLLRVHAGDGSTLAFAKVGWNDITAALVDHEASFLERCSTMRTRTFTVPRVVHRGAWRGRTLSVTSPLVGRPALRRPSPRADVLLEIAALDGRGAVDLSESSYRKSLEARASGLPAPSRRAVSEALARIDSRWPRHRLEVGRWHGDWTPWNMRTVGDRTLIWDWERTDAPVPVGFDMLHYVFQRLVATVRRPAHEHFDRAIAIAARSLRPLGTSDDDLAMIGQLYALEMYVRFNDPRIGGAAPAWLRRSLPRELDAATDRGSIGAGEHPATIRSRRR